MECLLIARYFLALYAISFALNYTRSWDGKAILWVGMYYKIVNRDSCLPKGETTSEPQTIFVNNFSTSEM